MAKLSEEELAQLVPCSPGGVRKLIELGILAPREEDKPFRSSDAHLVRLMTAFELAGISLDDVARGVAAGELSFRLDLFLPEPDEASGTYEALAAELGRSPELLRRLSSEPGLPPPADDRIRSDDAEMLSAIVTALDLVDDGELSRFARLYGGSIQRLIESALQCFDRAIHQRIIALDVSNEEKDILIDEKGASVIDLVNRLVPWLQRRLREHVVLEYIVTTTESYMDERGIAPRRPRHPPAIAFLDVTGYTALTEDRGDEAAAALAAGLATIVREAADAGRDQCRIGDRPGGRLLRKDGEHRREDRRLRRSPRGAGERRDEAKRRNRQRRVRACRGCLPQGRVSAGDSSQSDADLTFRPATGDLEPDALRRALAASVRALLREGAKSRLPHADIVTQRLVELR